MIGQAARRKRYDTAIAACEAAGLDIAADVIRELTTRKPRAPRDPDTEEKERDLWLADLCEEIEREGVDSIPKIARRAGIPETVLRNIYFHEGRPDVNRIRRSRRNREVS
jgi:hypothetical protein